MTEDGAAQLDDEIAGVRAALRWAVLLAGRLNPYHEPAGSPIGGQFAKAPGGGGLQVGDSPIAFLVKIQIDDANLPETHTAGLKRIDFQEQRLIASHSISGKIVEAYGTYDPDGQKILLASNAREGLGTSNISVIGGGSVLHEIGHHVHMRRLMDKAANEWAGISQNGQSARISAYARTNQGEHFAEAYRAYALGKEKRDGLRSLEPQSYRFMQKVFRSKADYIQPVGHETPAPQAWARYRGMP
jgi:hypothetical protein